MAMEPEQIAKLFEGQDPFLRIPFFMWERLVSFIEGVVVNGAAMVEDVDRLLGGDEDHEIEMNVAEFTQNSTLLVEEMNRIRNQVPGAGAVPFGSDVDAGNRQERLPFDR